MATSVVDIYNWALATVGTKARVQSPTEASPEAEQCTLWYETVRNQVLAAAPWASAKSYKRLALSVERDDDEAWVATDPAPGWRYAYAYPSDLLRPRFLTTYLQFEVGVNSLNQRVLYTNQEDAILCYTKRQTRVDLWDDELQAAVATALAAHIAMKLTGNIDRVRLATAQAVDKIIAARAATANSPQMQLEAVPEWIAARGSSLMAPSRPYIYPNAEFYVSGFGVGVD